MDYEIAVSEATAALRRVPFFLPSSDDGFTPVTGKIDANFTCRVSKNGGDALHGGTFVEHHAANQAGMYYYEATAGEVDTEGWLLLVISCADCASQRVLVRIGASNTDINAKTTNLPSDPADQSVVEAAISASEVNVISEVDANETKIDVVGSIVDAVNTRLPSDPADQSLVEAAVAASEGNIRGGSDTLDTLSVQLDGAQVDLTFLKNMEGGRWKIDDVANQMIFYKPDNVTEVARFDLKDVDGNPSSDDPFERTRV